MADLTKLLKEEPKKPEADLNFTIDEKDHLTEDAKKDTPQKPDKSNQKLSKHRLSKFTKKHYLISGLVLIFFAVILALIITTKPANRPVVITTKKVVTPKPIIYYSPLTGGVVTKAESLLPVTAVMVENSDAARPQSGLSQAGVVFEALAEGGVTRFMALFQEGQPSSIGPIRSARPYFIDWELGFNASYVHVGGSPAALTQIQTDNVKDINQFYHGNNFTRITSRIAPHNVYTSMSSLLNLESSLGFGYTKFVGFPRKADQPAKVPNATNINLSLSNSDYAVSYIYNKVNNSYLRSEAGSPMTDANTNAQLDPKVVIAMIVPWSYGLLDSSGANYINYSDIGSGNADIFQDGTLTQAIWTKASPTSQIVFTTLNNVPIQLNTGQTWITAVGTNSSISYQ
ncbi:MAG TPA: DUF3048 domain-containing protein [Candidatus Dormibacteraeota bacterium]|nr:DUF3048 domain-containing protein [Candidatus Dormibacteraeota bacterium]